MKFLYIDRSILALYTNYFINALLVGDIRNSGIHFILFVLIIYTTMSQIAEKNKDLIRYFLDEVFNKSNMTVIDNIIASDYKSHNKFNVEVLGPEGVKKAASMQHSSFQELHSEILDIIAENDKVVVRGKDTGIFKKEFMDIKPTGKKFSITWIDIFRIENGKIAESWLEIDSLEFKNQLTGNKIS
jgi:predicted ester cyclase